MENYGEAAHTDSLWQALERKAEDVRTRIAPEAADAFYQLVYYPAVGSSGVARMYLDAEQNRHYAALNDPRANRHADSVKALFARDSVLTAFYNDSLAGGKWRGMMQDKHIGYTMWSMPDDNILPEVVYVGSDAHITQEPAAKPMTEYSIPAIKYDRKTPGKVANWICLPDLGRGEGCMGADNVTAQSALSESDAPTLVYDIDVAGEDSVRIAVAILPTQDVNPERGLRLGFSLDGGEMRVVDARRGLVDTFDEYTPANLKNSKKLKALPPRGKMALNGYGKNMRNEVFDNLRWLDVTFPVENSGKHSFSITMIDPEIVVERIVVDPDNSRYSYFGPPERMQADVSK